MASLPMTDSVDGRPRSAIVWTVTKAPPPVRASLAPKPSPPKSPNVSVARSGISRSSPRRPSWPLGYRHAASYTADRLVLIGDAARRNSTPSPARGSTWVSATLRRWRRCWSKQCAPGRSWAPDMLNVYQAWRRFDNMMVGAVTDGLNRLFAIPGRLPSAVRRFGLAGVQRIAPLKQRFMAEARGEDRHIAGVADRRTHLAFWPAVSARRAGYVLHGIAGYTGGQ